MSYQKLNKNLINTALISTLACLSACQESEMNQYSVPASSKEKISSKMTMSQVLAQYRGQQNKKGEVVQGIDAMLAGNYEDAKTTFNQILLSDPTNATVHLLNGINYQLKASEGDVSVLNIAEAGFLQSLKFDPSNSLSSLQLGRVKKSKKEYAEAQAEFSNALLLDPTNHSALYELATTSYLMGDLKTARATIVRYLKIYPYQPEALQSASIIMSACGDPKQAQLYLSKLKNIQGEDYRAQEAQKRVIDWKKLYDIGYITLADASTGNNADPISTTQSLVSDSVTGDPIATANSLTATSQSNNDNGAGNPSPGDNTSPQNQAPLAPTAPGGAPDPNAPAAASENTTSAADPSAPIVAPGTPDKPTMVVIDTMIMRSSETDGSSKGQNILDNFSITLAPGTHLKSKMRSTLGAGASAPDFTSVPVFPGNGTTGGALASLASATITGGSQNPFAVSRLFTQGVTFGSVQYSLNIANTSRETIEIVDRPSVTTLIGQKGEFFSGTEYILGLSGQYGGTVSRTPVGIELVVTPTAYDPATDTVTLDIRMYGSILNVNGLADNVTTSFSQFSVSRVYTVVNMRMGETLMLGGIQSRQDQQQKDGFPILQDLPLIQYLFSNLTTQSDRILVTFLVTPRFAADAKKLTQLHFKNDDPQKRHELTELERRNKDWFNVPFPNWVVHYKGLEDLYREFKTGDVPDIHWQQPQSLEEKFAYIKSFFFY